MENVKVTPESIVIDGITFVPETTKPTGTRAVVVVDRGWIFAGDVIEKDGKIYLSRAVQVWRWESVGFDGMLANTAKAIVKKMPTDVVIPNDSEIFRCPVKDDWGL